VIFSAFFIISAAGDVLVMNVKERSSKMVISTGTMEPACEAVRSLYVLMNSIMLMPYGPSVDPTGGAGVALPAGICNFTTAVTFFATKHPPEKGGTLMMVRVSLPK
jgi:hypothetical protein